MRQFDAKLPAWMLVFIAVPVSVCLFSAVWALLQAPAQYALLPVAVLVLYLIVIRLLTYPLGYRIAAAELVICSGVYRNRVNLRRIVHVGPAKSLLPSAAPLSFDRLRLEYRGSGKNRALTLYPTDADAFLQALAAADPGLTRAIGGVYRVTA
ncbi:MAG: hypothetical protein GKR89_32950 [Candidatus Latescibacteria bacterium]|nr:hypothetical protein [Candidatus Latescibacterota bacterium]